ncbi:MAG: terminase [Acidobacteriota bacterium]
MQFEWGAADRPELVRLGEVLDVPDPAIRASHAGSLAAQLLRVRSRTGITVPLAANRAQREFEDKRGRGNIILKARQLGMTTWVAGQFFLKTITHPGTLTVQVAHTQEAAESIFRIVHRFLRLLPPSLCLGALKTSQVNARQILFPGMDSEYRVETAGAPNAGRGLTITNLHCSEVARWPGDPAETLQGLRAALAPGGELVLESTPMGASGCFWKEWQEAESSGLVRHFFPWWVEDAYQASTPGSRSLNEAETRLMGESGLSTEQIGYRRQLQGSFRGLARQEYAEDAMECFLTSGECVFDTGAIDARLRELPGPVREQADGLQVWLEPTQEREYLVAADPAGGGTEGDYSVAQVIDLQLGLQCAELQTRLPPLELARELARLARKYNNALLVVERNNHGSGVLAYLKSVCRYERLHETGGEDGWVTTSVTRPQILGSLGSALVESPQIFASERLLRECRSFIRHRNGRAEAQPGEHDDCVMAMAIALAVRDERLTGRRLH